MAEAQKNLVFFDLETTGLKVDQCEILSITAMHKDQTFSSLVKPIEIIPAFITKINHISNEMVQNADPWSVVGPSFLRWLYDTAGASPILSAFNGDGYDVAVLLHHNAKLPLEVFPPFTSIFHSDPLLIARRIIDKTKILNGSYKQCNVFEFLFGSQPADQHTSHGDVIALRAIAEHDLFKTDVCASARKLLNINGRAYVDKNTAQMKRKTLG